MSWKYVVIVSALGLASVGLIHISSSSVPKPPPLPSYTVGEHLLWKDCLDYVDVEVVAVGDKDILIKGHMEPHKGFDCAFRSWGRYNATVKINKDDRDIVRKPSVTPQPSKEEEK